MFVRTIYSCMSMSEPLLESRSCCARVEGGEGAAACHTIDAYLEIGRYGRHGREQSNNQPSSASV